MYNLIKFQQYFLRNLGGSNFVFSFINNDTHGERAKSVYDQVFKSTIIWYIMKYNK